MVDITPERRFENMVYMKKIREEMLTIYNKNEINTWFESFLNGYPVENGYRIECFVSPKFMRVSVYQIVETKDGEIE